MIERSTLDNWINGNYSELDRSDLIRLVKFYESGMQDDDICDDGEMI